jgi:hypothetical protein
MNILEGQVIEMHAHVMRDHARIVSGAYKTRKVYHGTTIAPENLLTEQELLEDELRAMDQHIHWLDKCVQALPKVTT